MCQALMDIMKPEIEEVIEKAEQKKEIKIHSQYGKTPEEIAELTNCSLEYVNSVLNE
mgnify:CR=1 FL=1